MALSRIKDLWYILALPMLMAKYSYTENTEQPGGFVELTIKQGEKLHLLQPKHFPSQNPLWWKVMNTQGQVGYVPANYCLVRSIYD